MAESKLGREGHRERMRNQYLSGGMDNAPDHNMIELYLSIIIPRRDVKQLSYDLFNRFGSLEDILNATPVELMSVKGVGVSTAIALSMIKKFNDRIVKNRNLNTNKLVTSDDIRKYCINELSNEVVEKLIQINLKSDGSIIRKYCISEGNVNSTQINMGKISHNAVTDKAAYVILSHNHLGGIADPSGSDLDVTIKLYGILDSLGIRLAEHVIVAGNNTDIIIHNPLYEKFFQKNINS